MRDIQVNKGLSGAGIAALSAALLVGGVGSGLGLMSLVNPPRPAKKSPPAAKSTVIEKTTTDRWRLGRETIVEPPPSAGTR